MPSGFRENAEDLNTAESVQVDVEAIRARLDAATARDVGPDDADIDAELDRVRSARLVLDGIAPVDLRDLLDENARLNAENTRYLRIISEITADNAGLTACLDAVRDAITPKNPDWKPLTERHPEWFKPVSPEEAARKKGWGQGVALLTQQIQAALDGPSAAPEMPRPPATMDAPAVPTAGGSTGVPEPENPAQESEWPDVDGWTIHLRAGGGLIVTHDTGAYTPVLMSSDSLPVGAVLAFIDHLPSLPVPKENDR